VRGGKGGRKGREEGREGEKERGKREYVVLSIKSLQFMRASRSMNRGE